MRPRKRFAPRLARAASALLGWTVERTAEEAGIDVELLRAHFAGEEELDRIDLEALGDCLNAAGVIVKPATHLAGEGVRFSRPEPDVATQLGLAEANAVRAYGARSYRSGRLSDLPFGAELDDE